MLLALEEVRERGAAAASNDEVVVAVCWDRPSMAVCLDGYALEQRRAIEATTRHGCRTSRAASFSIARELGCQSGSHLVG